jgi:hypothetical protein
MAARNIPMPETGATITIDSSFTPNHQGVIVQQNSTVTFTNNSGSDITIEFQANPPGVAVYPNMNLPVPNQSSSSFTAPNANTSANYYVYQGGTQQSGPWVIQVGSGPMYVQLTTSGGDVICTPENVAVPLGTTASKATINFAGTGSFTITWTSSDPCNPPLTSLGSGTINPGAGNGQFAYTVTSTGPQPAHRTHGGHTTNDVSPTDTVGGGKVIIRGS